MRWIVPLLFALACGTDTEPIARVPEVHAQYQAQRIVDPPPESEADEADEPVGPYDGWEIWCEPFDYNVPCRQAKDCADVYPSHPARRPLKCVTPDKRVPEARVCAPGYARKSEQQWRRDRLREIVRQQYFGETSLCELDGRPMHKEHWRCQRAAKQAEKLTTFLWIHYMRETTARPWKRHRLESDLRANRTSWFKGAKTYGWNIEVLKNGQAGTLSRIADVPTNESYPEQYRWRYGLGAIGQNVALWVHRWDPEAPPEVLCREVVSFEAYLRKAREALRQLRGGVRCNGKPYHERTPTWTTVHRVANLGSLCPVTKPKQVRGAKRFRQHALRDGLDPDEIVTTNMLGTPIGRDGQNERARAIEMRVEEKFPPSVMTR